MNKDLLYVYNEIHSLLLLKNKYNVIEYDIKNLDEDTPKFDEYAHIITIYGDIFWNQVYQLSHELLHAAFYERNGTNKSEYRWIEEIICEAFSIYCLKRYCRNEYNLWKIYLYPYIYYRNGNCKTREIVSSEHITTINDLNNRLLNYKSYETRQFIHPLCLLIVNVIDNDKHWLWDALRFEKYIENNKFIDCNNEIILLIKDFIQLKQLQ